MQVNWAWRGFMHDKLTHIWRQAALRERRIPCRCLKPESINKLDEGSVGSLMGFMLWWDKRRKKTVYRKGGQSSLVNCRLVIFGKPCQAEGALNAPQLPANQQQHAAQQQRPSRAFCCQIQ